LRGIIVFAAALVMVRLADRRVLIRPRSYVRPTTIRAAPK
jgi:hypothetical protein